MRPGEPLRVCDLCGKDGLKGQVALTMHKRRAHEGKNWSTKRKSLRLDPKIATTVAVVLGLLLSVFLAAPARANQAGGTVYCTPPNTIINGQKIDATPVQANDAHAETCGGQLGDFFTDGPLFDPTFSYSGSSFAFTIPANTWVAFGRWAATLSTSETATASATNYIWLDAATRLWTITTANSPPTPTSVLEYTVVANGSGISSVTDPTLAGLTLHGVVTFAALSDGCLQLASHAVTSTGSACGSGDGGSGGTISAYASGITPPSGLTSGSLSSSTFTGQGKLYLGDVLGYGTLDYGTSTASQFTFSDPVNISSIESSGSIVFCPSHNGCSTLAINSDFDTPSNTDISQIGNYSLVGDINISGTAHLNGDANVGGNFNQSDSSKTFTVNGAATFYSTETHYSDETHYGNLTFWGGIFQGASGTFADVCSMASSTTCTGTIAVTYAHPLCFATEQGLTADTYASCDVSGTTVTVTAHDANSATWAFHVEGDPN